MNNKALTLSLAMAALAVFFVQSYVSSIEEEAKKKFGTAVLVVKAKKDIKEQETINEKMLELSEIPAKFLEPNAISFAKGEIEKETSQGLRVIVNNVALVPIKAGEQITTNKITEPSIRTGLSPQVTPGKRAVSVPVSEVTGVSKLVKPGDRVDLIAVLDRGSGKENRVVKTILQDVVVLSIGRHVTNNLARVVEADPYGGKEKIRPLSEDTSFTSVAVEVDPTQAQMLTLILANGENSISLALRNNDDTERTGIAGMTADDVLGGDAARFPRGPASRR